jgi:predicted acylesterase/phospholipase RssA
MGAIVGGLYAIGYSPDEIERWMRRKCAVKVGDYF